MSRHRKPYRAPWVLDIHAPVKPTQAEMDQRLDDMMRGLWEDDEYWAEHGIPKPEEPYPGIAEIRARTGV